MLWLGSLAALLILVAGIALWRLMQGPISLDRFTPYVEAALNRSAGGLHIAISGVRFGIDRATRQFDLSIEGVRLALPDGEPLAAFPEMSASFSLAAMLRGRLAPTRLVVERPVLRLVRNEAGHFKFRFADADTDTEWLRPDLLAEAAGPVRPDALLGRLRRVEVRNATLLLDDRQSGRRWRAERVDAAVWRNPTGLEGDLSLALPIAAATPRWHAHYRYAAAARLLDFAIDVTALEPSALTSLLPALAPLDALHFPVSGRLTARFDIAAGKPERARLDLALGQGAVRSALLAQGQLAFRSGRLQAIYDGPARQLQLARLDLDLGGGARLLCDGRFDDIESALSGAAARTSGRLGVRLTGVRLDRLASLWPPTLSPGGQRWVTANLHHGVLDEAAFDIGVRFDPAAGTADVTALAGRMRYHDLTIDYLRDLPPLRQVSGTATATLDELDFTPTGGNVNGVQVVGGTVKITGLNEPDQWLTVDAVAAGPIRGALQVVDGGSLRYAHEIGLDPARVEGRMETQLHFRLPLIKDLRLADVEYGVKAKLGGAGIAQVALGRDLSDGNFTLDITAPGARLQGRARFDGTPIAIDADVLFRPKNGVRGRYKVGLTLDDDARRRLGLPAMPGRLTGPVAVDLTYLAMGGGRAEVMARLDLAVARLAIAEAGWSKPPGAPATARLTLALDHDRLAGLPRVEVAAKGLSGRFAVTLGRDGGLERVDIRRLVIADDDLAGSLQRRRDGGWRADISGARLDLGPWLRAKDDSSSAGPPLQIAARLDRLILGPRREIRDLSAQLFREGGYWQRATLDGRFANGHRLALRFGPVDGKRRLDFTADDLGATLALLDITDDIVGGHIRVTGEVSDSGGKRVLHGHAEGGDYSLEHAPVTARVLSLASLSGPAAMLSDRGIPFSSLRGDFRYGDGRLTIDELLAYGGALGATASGTVDLEHDRIDLQGTIVPAYTLNSALGKVPVIGNLLLGGEGQGLFAANYSVSGSESDPKVSVNPLSALAPGFLRRLMQPNFGLPDGPGGGGVEYPPGPTKSAE